MKLRTVVGLAAVVVGLVGSATNCNLVTGADDIEIGSPGDGGTTAAGGSGTGTATAGTGGTVTGAGGTGGTSTATGGTGGTATAAGGSGTGVGVTGGTGGTGGTCAPGGTGGTVAGHTCSVTDPNGTGEEPGCIIPVCCTPTAGEQTEIDQVFVLLNAHRQANGVAPLSYDTQLEAAIQSHCMHMSLHPFWSHTAPEPSVASPWSRASQCGTSASGENIAMGQSTPEAVMTSWTNSAGHNANMLNPSFTRVGIGRYAPYWGQIFGN